MHNGHPAINNKLSLWYYLDKRALARRTRYILQYCPADVDVTSFPFYRFPFYQFPFLPVSLFTISFFTISFFTVSLFTDYQSLSRLNRQKSMNEWMNE
jgi:hypothetical protein